MYQRCTGLTKKGSKCKRLAPCRWHKEETCPVCLDEIQFKDTHKTSCSHTFHKHCIMNWYIMSDDCPVCRHTENEDPVIVFKRKFHEQISENYLDTIRTLEHDVTRYRRRLHRALRDD